MKTIDDAIFAMYDSISFERGERPDWNRHREIFAPDARLMRITDDGMFVFNSESYIQDIESKVISGEMPSFWEREIWRETREFDDMAHVLSAYESRRSRTGAFLGRGVNSIQLFRVGENWRIGAMTWRRDGEHVRISDDPEL